MIDSLDYNKAKEIYRKDFFAGRHKDFPIGSYAFPFGCRYEEDRFLLVSIDQKFITNSPPENLVLAKEYIKIFDDKFPHIWMSFGRTFLDRFAKHSNGLWKIVDGRHRYYAAMEIGRTIKSWVPESHYRAFLEETL